MDEMSKNMSFDYPEKPKFPEQETGHVYFDTVEGSSDRTEKRRYTYATADGSVTGSIDYPEIGGMNFKKIHDFMSEEDLSNGDKIKFFSISNPENETAISSREIQNGASSLPDYSGEAAISVTSSYGPILMSFDSALTTTIEGGTFSFPEPGLYLCEIADAAAEGGVGVSITVEIPAETNPFSKNVNVKAHTEYTAIKNARAQGPEIEIDISKTLFDKEEPVEEASNEETP